MAALIAGALLLVLGLYFGVVPTSGCGAAWTGSGGEAPVTPETSQSEGLGFFIVQNCEQIRDSNRRLSVFVTLLGLILMLIALALWPRTSAGGWRDATRRWSRMAGFILGAGLLLPGLYVGLLPSSGCGAAWTGWGGGSASTGSSFTRSTELRMIVGGDPGPVDSEVGSTSEDTQLVGEVGCGSGGGLLAWPAFGAVAAGLLLLTIARGGWPAQREPSEPRSET
ncbi:hypothetical protein ACMYYO_07320 [Dermacoccaceae bacterium W4C1]